jgi:hypothetical protein
MDEDESRESQAAEDPFDMMMFGSRNKNTETENLPPSSSVDYEELMENIDALFDSAKKLKPLFHKVFPVIEQLWKKG